MPEYIEREAVIDLITRRYENPEICTQEINSIPAADVAPVVHARWVSFLDGDHIMPERYYRCSRCGRVESRRQPYCHCGAKMDGGDTFVAKRLRDSNAFPEVVTRCKNCKHSTLPSEFTQRYGKPGTLTCHNRYSPCNRRNVGENDFCSYGKPKEG